MSLEEEIGERIGDDSTAETKASCRLMLEDRSSVASSQTTSASEAPVVGATSAAGEASQGWEAITVGMPGESLCLSELPTSERHVSLTALTPDVPIVAVICSEG